MTNFTPLPPKKIEKRSLDSEVEDIINIRWKTLQTQSGASNKMTQMKPLQYHYHTKT